MVLNAFIVLCFQKSIVSAIGKVDQEGELSLSIGNQEVTLSLYQTPDLSERDAEKVCEMFAEEIAESISENNKYVELPPLRFTKETAKASNINMEAIVIDIDRQDLEEYESMKRELENIDDLKTECDIEDVSVADWNEPVKGTEFEAFVCEEIMEIKDEMFEASTEILHDKKTNPEQALDIDNKPASHLQETDTIKRAPKKVQIDGTINNLTPQTVPNTETQMPTDDERGEGVKSSKDLVGELSSNLNTVAKIPDIKSHEVETSTVLGKAIAGENHEAITVEKVHLGEQKAELVNGENSVYIEDFESKTKTLDPSSEERSDVKIETKQITENIIETDTSGVSEVKATVEKIDSTKEQTKPESVVIQENSSQSTKNSEGIKTNNNYMPEDTVPKTSKDISQAEYKPESINPKESEQINKKVSTVDGPLKHEEEVSPKDIESARQTNKDISQASQPATETTQEISLFSKPVHQTNPQEVSKIEKTVKQSNQDITKITESVQLIRKDVTSASESARETNKENSLASEPIHQTIQEVSQIGESVQQTNQDVPKLAESVLQTQQEIIPASNSVNENNQDISHSSEPLQQTDSQKTDNNQEKREPACKPMKEETKKESEMRIEVEIPDKNEMSTHTLRKDSIQFEVEVSFHQEDDVTDANTELSKSLLEAVKTEDASVSEKSSETVTIEPLTIVEVNEAEAKGIIQHNETPVILEKTSPSDSQRVKKQSRQESVVDSEGIPDIEELDQSANKDLLINEDLDDSDEEFEAFKRERRSRSNSNFEETLAGMDPEILKELGLGEGSEEKSKDTKEVLEMDLSQLPEETTEERMRRIEEKASGIVIEEDIVPRKSRSRSRSRSKSRPPNLETVKEQKKDEIIEAAKFYGILPSLDTIKESPSTASMLGMLQGGMSSASVHNMLQESVSAASLNKDSILSPGCDKKSFSQINENIEEDGVVETDTTNYKQEECKNDSILGVTAGDGRSDHQEPINGEKSKKKKAQRSDTVSLLPPEGIKDAEEADMPVGIKLTNLEMERKEVKAQDAQERCNPIKVNPTTTTETKVETKNDKDQNEQNIKEKKQDEKVNALRELALKEKQEIMRVKEEATKSALLQNKENHELVVASQLEQESRLKEGDNGKASEKTKVEQIKSNLDEKKRKEELDRIALKEKKEEDMMPIEEKEREVERKGIEEKKIKEERIKLDEEKRMNEEKIASEEMKIEEEKIRLEKERENQKLQERLAVEEKKKEEERIQLEETRKKEEASKKEKIRQEEEERTQQEEAKKKENEEKIRQEEEKKKKEEERLRQEEEERLEEVRKKEEEERKRLKEAKKKDEEERIRHEKAKKKEEEERIQLEEAKKKEEEERIRLEEAKKKEERIRQEEMIKKEEEERIRQAEARKKEEVERLRQEEAKKKEKIQQEEEKKIKQEEARKEEEERIRQDEARKEEEERVRQEETRKKDEEERLRQEEARKKDEEERTRQEKASKKEEEERIKQEEARKEEQLTKGHAEKKKAEERKKEEEQMRKALAKKEEEEKKALEEKKQEEETKRLEEQERLAHEKKKEQDKQKLEEERKRKEEQERLELKPKKKESEEENEKSEKDKTNQERTELRQEAKETRREEEKNKEETKEKKQDASKKASTPSFVPGYLEKQGSLESFEEAEEKNRRTEEEKRRVKLQKEKQKREEEARIKLQEEERKKEEIERARLEKEKREEEERVRLENERLAKEERVRLRIAKEKREEEEREKARIENERIAEAKEEDEREKVRIEKERHANEEKEKAEEKLKQAKELDRKIEEERKPKENEVKLRNDHKQHLEVGTGQKEPTKSYESSLSQTRTKTSTGESSLDSRSVTRRTEVSGRSESDRSSGDFSLRQLPSPAPSHAREAHNKTPDMRRYETISPTFDSRTRNISGDYRETVEKSMTTSQNLMSIVTGSLVQKKEQPKVRPQTQQSATKKPAQKSNVKDLEKEGELRKRALQEKNRVAGSVADIMIKEVGSNWVSLCWKKPPVSRGSPVITYKVESWLCGEGAFWVELGRTPIPQFDAFNLKPNKCYHFRVTARNKGGWGEALMTMHKVDLSKPTQMPVISSNMDSVIKCLKGSSVSLSVKITGEPAPRVTWTRDCVDTRNIDGTSQNDSGDILDIEAVTEETEGKYTVTATNTAGRATKSVQVQMVNNEQVFAAYKKFEK